MSQENQDSKNLRDNSVVSGYGYKHDLKRSLKSFSLFAVAFSIVSISTGVFLNFGWGLNAFGPAMIWTWPIAAIGQIVMALIIAELASKIPLAGYAYQWGSRLVNSTYGWFTGFLALLYMTITGGAIILTGCAPLLLNSFGINPTKQLVLSVAIILILSTIVINLISVQLAAKVNNGAVFAEIAGTVVFAIVILFAWGMRGSKSGQSFSFLTNSHGTLAGAGWYKFAIAGLIGIYTMVGFELSADLTEEAVDSQKAVPRGIILGLSTAAILGMFSLIAFTVAIPDLAKTQKSGLPLVDIASYWLPSLAVHILTLLVAFSMFALVVMNQAAQARLLYSMARDNMLPFSDSFKKVNERTKTPLHALVIGGIASLGLMIYGYFQSNTFATLIGSTAIAPYLVYLLIVLSYMNKRKKLALVSGGFNLGKWGFPLMIIGLVWVITALLVLTLPAIFHGAVRVVFGGLLIAFLWWILVLRGRIQRKVAGVALFENTLDAIKSNLTNK
jgi:amino acid transporter